MYPTHGRSSRGRGRGGWSRGRDGGFSLVPQAPSTPAPPLGDILKTLKLSDLDTTDERPCEIHGTTFVGSYNWLNLATPTIRIPGLPPTWTPPQTHPQLEEDSGDYFRDINAARFPSHPMHPAVAAILSQQQLTDLDAIDVFACGSTISNLLRFVRREDKPFRMIVEVVNNTVFLIRRENSPREKIQGIRGYGHSMPEAYTTWQEAVKGSESHQRIIRYTFAGLNCLVRFEADGYLPNRCPDLSITSEMTNESQSSSNDDLDLAKALESSAMKPKVSDDKSLSTSSAGGIVPQSALFDLKTRSIKRQGEDFLAEQLLRLWITQVPNFILGFHNRGRFVQVREDNVQADVQQWAENNNDKLSKFGVLLKELIAFAKGSPEKRIELEYVGYGDLRIREVGGDAGEPLPAELKNQWVAKAKPEEASEE